MNILRGKSLRKKMSTETRHWNQTSHNFPHKYSLQPIAIHSKSENVHIFPHLNSGSVASNRAPSVWSCEEMFHFLCIKLICYAGNLPKLHCFKRVAFNRFSSTFCVKLIWLCAALVVKIDIRWFRKMPRLPQLKFLLFNYLQTECRRLSAAIYYIDNKN